MAGDSNPTPSINIYNVASDDTLWVLQTDHQQLLRVLADPPGWVSTHVLINDEPATLRQPFVFVFNEVAPSARTPSIHFQGVQTPIIHVQGIHETSIVTVRYSQSSAPPPPPTGLLPDDETLAIIQVGEVVHTHIHLKGFKPGQVANTIFTTVSSPSAFLEALNALPQTLNGVPVSKSDKRIFRLKDNASPHFVYHGWRSTKKKAAGAKDAASGHEGEMDDDSCMMSDGNADSQGNVWLNGVIVKTYALPPSGGGN